MSFCYLIPENVYGRPKKKKKKKKTEMDWQLVTNYLTVKSTGIFCSVSLTLNSGALTSIWSRTVIILKRSMLNRSKGLSIWSANQYLMAPYSPSYDDGRNSVGSRKLNLYWCTPAAIVWFGPLSPPVNKS